MKKPKYSIGDRLWHIYDLGGKCHLASTPFDCSVISLERNEFKYGYTTSFQFYEINVFPSKEEAQAECDKRNGVLFGSEASR